MRRSKHQLSHQGRQNEPVINSQTGEAISCHDASKNSSSLRLEFCERRLDRRCELPDREFIQPMLGSDVSHIRYKDLVGELVEHMDLRDSGPRKVFEQELRDEVMFLG